MTAVSTKAESDRGLGGDPDTELVPEAAVAVGESQMLDVQDEVDLREAPTEVATEGRAVIAWLRRSSSLASRVGRRALGVGRGRVA
jgi:hypothetical protein